MNHIVAQTLPGTSFHTCQKSRNADSPFSYFIGLRMGSNANECFLSTRDQKTANKKVAVWTIENKSYPFKNPFLF